MMHLRRMCIIRRGQLANTRKQSLNRLPIECFCDGNLPHPTETVMKLHAMASFIRANGSEDHRVWSATMCSVFRGVSGSYAACLLAQYSMHEDQSYVSWKWRSESQHAAYLMRLAMSMGSLHAFRSLQQSSMPRHRYMCTHTCFQ